MPKSISIFLLHSEKSKSGQKTHKTNSVTVSHVKQEEDISAAGQIVSPNGGKTLYIGNQEMSDKLRNGLRRKCRRLRGFDCKPCKKRVRIIYTIIVLKCL